MNTVLTQLIDWSEAWALIIPISVFAARRKQPAYMKPVVLYLGITLFINLAIDIIWKYQNRLHFPHWLRTNNYLYNVHSIVRLFLFSRFFLLLKQPFLVWLKKGIPIISVLFIGINFLFFERFISWTYFSSRLLSLEAFFLMIYCFLYYVYKLKDEGAEEESMKQPDFWVVTGLSIYVVINFFIFLFYVSLVRDDINFAVGIWYVHNCSFIIMCVFIAKALYAGKPR